MTATDQTTRAFDDMRELAAKVAKVAPGVQGNTALAVVNVLAAMGRLTDVQVPPPRDTRTEALAAQLAETVARLDGYIQRRAEDLAAPQIAEARRTEREAVDDLTARYEADHRRSQDLVDELHRQLDVQLRMVDRYLGWLVEAGVDPRTGAQRSDAAAKLPPDASWLTTPEAREGDQRREQR
jgi:hypothetical protein